MKNARENVKKYKGKAVVSWGKAAIDNVMEDQSQVWLWMTAWAKAIARRDTKMAGVSCHNWINAIDLLPCTIESSLLK